MAKREEVPIEAYKKAVEISNKISIEKPWTAIYETEDGTIMVYDSETGISCSFCDWEPLHR